MPKSCNVFIIVIWSTDSFYFTFKCYLLHFSCDVMGTVFPEYLELQTTCDLSVILICKFVLLSVCVSGQRIMWSLVDYVRKKNLFFFVFNFVVNYAVQKPCHLEIRIKLHLPFSLQCEIKPIKVQESQAGFFILPLYLTFVFKSIQENSADFPQY